MVVARHDEYLIDAGEQVDEFRGAGNGKWKKEADGNNVKKIRKSPRTHSLRHNAFMPVIMEGKLEGKKKGKPRRITWMKK